MKRLFILSIAFVFLISCVKIKNAKRISAGNSQSEKTYHLDFDKIKVSQGIHASVVKADNEKIHVSGASNILNQLVVEVEDGILLVHFKDNVNLNFEDKDLKVKIYAKDFDEIKASSSAEINVEDQFTQERMDIDVSSSGEITGDFEANDLDIEATSSSTYDGKIWALKAEISSSSSADVNISGAIDNAEIRSSSSGRVTAKNVKVKVADLKASSSGNISLTVTQQVQAQASSSGDIEVYKAGNVSISKSESSGGSVAIH